MRSLSLALAALAALSISVTSRAGTEENADEFMELHKVEIAFHEAGSTKNLNEMLSLFADDAVLTTIRKTDDGKEQIKTYTGKEQIKNYWQAHPAFQPQNQWVGYTPAFRIRYTVEGPMTSRSNCAKDRRTLRVNRPIEVVVLNCCVTETKDAALASRISTILAKSAGDNVSAGSNSSTAVPVI